MCSVSNKAKGNSRHSVLICSTLIMSCETHKTMLRAYSREQIVFLSSIQNITSSEFPVMFNNILQIIAQCSLIPGSHILERDHTGRVLYLFSCEHDATKRAKIFRAESQHFACCSSNYMFNLQVGYIFTFS